MISNAEKKEYWDSLSDKDILDLLYEREGVDGHNTQTPWPIVEVALDRFMFRNGVQYKKFKVAPDMEFAVFYNLEWVVELKERGFDMSKVTLFGDSETKRKVAQKFGAKYMDVNDVDKCKMKKPVVLMNPPYTDGVYNGEVIYHKHIENVVKKLDPTSLLIIAPDSVLLDDRNPNKNVREMLIETYGTPTYVNWLSNENDWHNTVTISTQLSIWDKSNKDNVAAINSRLNGDTFNVDLDLSLLFHTESTEEYDYVKRIQTEEKIKVKKFNPTGQIGQQIKLRTNDQFEIEAGKEFNSNNHMWRQVVAQLRSSSLVDLGPGPSVPSKYRELVCQYSPTDDASVSKKFGDYMRSKHTRFLVLRRHSSKSMAYTAFKLVPVPDLDKLPDNFTDQDLYEYFNTPQSVIDEIEKIGDKSPY